MLSITQATGNFFDKKAVQDAVGRANVKALSKCGALIRKTAQKSIAYAPDSAPAGQPPHGHRTMIRVSKTRRTKSGAMRKQAVSPLREFLYFSYDFGSQSVVVGPVRLNSKIGDAPHALEYGATSVVQSKGRRRSAAIAAHSFMRPALAANLDAIPPQWRDTVKAV